ncbi:MAG: beta-lactamase family protein [Thermomicrobiales bacterium]|nr:beta-lactamase family protein [Thermomicrobiales bacterium]
MTPAREQLSGATPTRRGVLAALGAAGISLAEMFGGPAGRRALAAQDATPVAEVALPTAQRAAIKRLGEEGVRTHDLKALLIHVIADGEPLTSVAFGETMNGIPATPQMHLRNGAVAIMYMTTLLLIYVDDGLVTLDDPIAAWLPDLPEADEVTLKMLANMTAGYPDFVQNLTFQKAFYDNPFAIWTGQQLIDFGLATPRVFAPGANWDYSHTNYVILGQALEQIGGAPLDQLLQARVLTPLGLANTQAFQTSQIPDPVLHAFSSERRQTLAIPAALPFYEETTFWNPSWTLAPGAVQVSTVADMAASALAVAEGTLLSPASHAAQISKELIGFGAPLDGCPACHTLDTGYSYGLGTVLSGDWVLQNPLLAGYGSIAAGLPGRNLAIAVATTFSEACFDDEGNNRSSRASWDVFAEIAAVVAPDAVPAMQRPT